MLVIRRRLGERICITGGIAIEVLEITPSRVKLGIEAPRSLTVLRSEVLANVQENQRAASTMSPERAADMAGWLQPAQDIKP